MSNFIIKFDPLTFFFKDFISSWANSILLFIILPLTKPACSFDIIIGRIGTSLVINNFEIILLQKLHRLMGLSCLKEEGFSTFGTGSRLADVQALGSSPPTKNSEIARKRSSLI